MFPSFQPIKAQGSKRGFGKQGIIIHNKRAKNLKHIGLTKSSNRGGGYKLAEFGNSVAKPYKGNRRHST